MNPKIKIKHFSSVGFQSDAGKKISTKPGIALSSSSSKVLDLECSALSGSTRIRLFSLLTGSYCTCFEPEPVTQFDPELPRNSLLLKYLSKVLLYFSEGSAEQLWVDQKHPEL